MIKQYSSSDIYSIIVIDSNKKDDEGNMIVDDGAGSTMTVPADKVSDVLFIKDMCLVTDGVDYLSLSKGACKALFKEMNKTNTIMHRTFNINGSIVVVHADTESIDTDMPYLNYIGSDTTKDMRPMHIGFPVPDDWEGTNREYVNHVMKTLTKELVSTVYFS